ncbi:DUF3017 domain-containing protein [Streptomyces sp. NPDC029526]|uniref:DUF3017 domain-containing protein n=1 Tax=Streptomyces sp. NPDC029526 TaxID=3155728 RepID=UPI0033F580CF
MRDAGDEPVEDRAAHPGARDDEHRTEAAVERSADGPGAEGEDALARDGAQDGAQDGAPDGAPDGSREGARGGEGAEAPGAPAEDASDEEIVVRDPVSAPDARGRPRRATRRFPLFTRDTARPEGGGRAAAGDAPAPARQWPILAVLFLVALGLLLTASDLFRLGTLLIGVALLTGAVLRWVVPDVGMLAVRSRFTDIVTYGVLGIGIVVLALMVQPDPKLQIPFLKDLLHFTVSG